jgi:triose-phosphate isomerase
VNVDNASAYLQIDGVDGLLIGDTSLDVRAFAEIIKKADVIDKAVARKAA